MVLIFVALPHQACLSSLAESGSLLYKKNSLLCQLSVELSYRVNRISESRMTRASLLVVCFSKQPCKLLG